jgi:hypothetical protein
MDELGLGQNPHSKANKLNQRNQAEKKANRNDPAFDCDISALNNPFE